MPVDTSIYGNQQQVQFANPLEAKKEAMSLSRMAMQNMAGAQELQSAKRDDAMRAHLQKAQIFGQELDSLSGLAPDQRQQAYGRVREQLVGQGIAKPEDMPAEFDPGWYNSTLNRYHQTKDYLDKQLTRAQTSSLYANARQKNQGSNKFLGEVEKQSAKNFAKLQESAANSQDVIDKVDSTLAELDSYMKKHGPTGPTSTAMGFNTLWNEDAERLDRQFNDLALDKMRTMFAGMSKAIDSDAERRFFMGTVGGLKNRPSTNAKLLLGAKSMALKSQAEAEAQRRYIESSPNGSLEGYVSPVKGKVTAAVGPNGEMRLVPKGSLTKEARDMGYMSVDDYAKTVGPKGSDRRSDSLEPSAYAGSGKVRVSNGKETYMIDLSDLPDAKADGFEVLR